MVLFGFCGVCFGFGVFLNCCRHVTNAYSNDFFHKRFLSFPAWKTKVAHTLFIQLMSCYICGKNFESEMCNYYCTTQQTQESFIFIKWACFNSIQLQQSSPLCSNSISLKGVSSSRVPYITVLFKKNKKTQTYNTSQVRILNSRNTDPFRISYSISLVYTHTHTHTFGH